MKLYLLEQTVNNGYDTYDSCIVCAESEEEAKRIHPSNYYECGENDHWYFVRSDDTKIDEGENPKFSEWCAIKDVQVEYLGEAKKGSKKGVIIASFNAG